MRNLLRPYDDRSQRLVMYDFVCTGTEILLGIDTTDTMSLLENP